MSQIIDNIKRFGYFPPYMLKSIEKYGDNPYYNYVRNVVMHHLTAVR